MDLWAFEELLHRQSGLIRRDQVLELGGDDNDIERFVRRRLWVRVHRGVFVEHSGELDRDQRAWATVLRYWPAAVCGPTALDHHGIRMSDRPQLVGRQDTVHVAVDATRRVAPAVGVRVHRLNDFDGQALMNLSPPRVRVEQAVLETASMAKTEREAVAILAQACQARRTTAQRLLLRLDQLPRLPRRRILAVVLADVAAGAYSVLERSYLTEVERPHGLPTARRQRRVRPGRTPAVRDVEYVALRVVVELDGRLGHERVGDRWADLDRDVDAALIGDLTLRLGWGQVLEPCRVANAVARILIARGWTGPPRACGPRCSLAGIRGVFPAPDAGNTPRSA